MSTTEEIIIRVQEIEPRLRHATIFQTYENLNNGETFIIHNNHDPMPVYYQLQQMHGDTFSWEYIQEGPEWWDIRVTKRAASAPSIFENENGNIVVNVPNIEPRVKHATIFKVFDYIQPGKSMIIHNDHDPKPVYYQLINERGDIFTWQYLQQGPQWWDILITKKQQTQTGSESYNSEIEKDAHGNRIINVPQLEPRLKHATIFKVFDELNEGESLVIHNDHDPKPVYYQLLNERGDIFTWQYLQEGPEWWDIKVTKKYISSNETVGEIAAKDLRKVEIFKKYGIDFCCGGRKTVREASIEKGIDPAVVEKELQQPVQIATNNHTNYNEWELDFLSDYIINIHHNYVRKYAQEIKNYAAKVAQVHGKQHPELHSINKLVEKGIVDLSEHMISEEKHLFPLVKKLIHARNNQSTYTRPENFNLKAFIEKHEQEHDSAGRDFAEIRKISQNFAIPDDACTSYKLLYKMLDEFENDLHLHIHLENNILFPKAIALEELIAK